MNIDQEHLHMMKMKKIADILLDLKKIKPPDYKKELDSDLDLDLDLLDDYNDKYDDK